MHSSARVWLVATVLRVLSATRAQSRVVSPQTTLGVPGGTTLGVPVGKPAVDPLARERWLFARFGGRLHYFRVPSRTSFVLWCN